MSPIPLLRPLAVALALLLGAAETNATAGEPVRLGKNLEYDLAQFRPDLCQTPSEGRFWMQVGGVTLAAPADRVKTILPQRAAATMKLERTGEDPNQPFLSSSLTTTAGCPEDPFPVFLATVPTAEYPLLSGFRVNDVSSAPVGSTENLRKNFKRFRAYEGCKTGSGWRLCPLTDGSGKQLLFYLPDVKDIETSGGRPFFIRCERAARLTCEMADMMGATFRITAVLNLAEGPPKLEALDQAVDELNAISELVGSWRR